MLLSQSHISLTEANRVMIAQATADYLQRGEAVTPATPSARAPLGYMTYAAKGETVKVKAPRQRQPRDPSKPNGPRLKRDALVPQLVELLGQGLNPPAIARRLDISRNTVAKIAAENAINLYPQGNPA